MAGRIRRDRRVRSAFAPTAIISTAQLFKRCYAGLDAACLGALEVDAEGNVNVSTRGAGVRDSLRLPS